jgi:uncharacterized protein
MKLKLNPKIEVRPSPIQGKGLFAKQPFKKGEKFRVTTGEHPSVIMTDEEFEAYKKTADHWDAVALGNGTHRVGTLNREDDPSNYGNHSCDPNIAPVDNGGSVALRDIAAGEEITADYAQFSQKGWTMQCNCGAKNCKGIVKGAL